MTQDIEPLKKLLNSLANPLRLECLLSISEGDGASYSDLLGLTERHGVKPNVLAYHLKQLRRSLLIYRGEDKRYRLTHIGRSVVKTLVSLQRESTGAEKKQWLQSPSRPRRITKDFLFSMFSGLGVPSHSLPALVEGVYRKVQSLPLQTIPPSILLDLVNASMIESGLYSHLSPTLQLGHTISEIEDLAASTQGDPRSLSDGLSSGVLFDYFLQRFLPLQVRDAHYMGRINLENGRNPLIPSRVAVKPSVLNPQEGEALEALLSMARSLRLFSQAVSQELEVFNAQEILLNQRGGDRSAPPPLHKLLDVLSPNPSILSLGFVFPFRKSPRSPPSRATLRQILGSASRGGGGVSLIYYLPPSVPFIKEYRGVLDELVSSLVKGNRNALFANHMFPWQRDHLYFRDGLRLPMEGEDTPIVAGFASINLPLIAAESGGNRSVFQECLFEAIRRLLTYFTQKRAVLEGNTPINPSPSRGVLRPYYYVNLHRVEAIPRIIGDAAFPSRSALALLLDLIGEVKTFISTLSRENDLEILLSSVRAEGDVEALFEEVVPRDRLSGGGDELEEIEGSTLVHVETTLQKFFDGGRTPLPLTSPPMRQILAGYGNVSDFFSEEEVSTLSLYPF